MSACQRLIAILCLVAWGFLPPTASAQPAHARSQNTPGSIAYVKNGNEIRLIEPDGSNDRTFWLPPGQGYVTISALDWRPDGRSLAFTSDYEASCSWFERDVYVISARGGNLQRLTNRPDCAGLAALPLGSVTVHLQNRYAFGDRFQVYIQGSPVLKSVTIPAWGAVTVTFEQVAEFGPGAVQPVVAILGSDRWTGQAYADVLAGQTVDAGNLVIQDPASHPLGAGAPKWRQDGAAVAYGWTNCGQMYEIGISAPLGAIGQPLLPPRDNYACALDRGPTAATADDLLYSTVGSYEGGGVYRTQVGSSEAELLVPLSAYDASGVHDIEWLPDGSGFLFAKSYVDLGIFGNIFRYDFATRETTRLTQVADDERVEDLSISPDGTAVVYQHLSKDRKSSTLWIMNIDGSGARLLAKNASHPAWGSPPPPLNRKALLPLLAR